MHGFRFSHMKTWNRPEEVYVADFRKYSPLLPVRFFRSMIPEAGRSFLKQVP